MRLILCLAAGLTAVACGPNPSDSGGTSDGGPPETMQMHEYFIAAEEAYCGWAATCGAYETADVCLAHEFFDVWFQTNLLASGVFSAGSTFGPRGTAVKYLLAAHDAGRIEFDAQAATDCLAYVKSRGCDRPESVVPDEAQAAGIAACKAVFRGTMVRNGPCYSAAECAAEDGAEVVCGLNPSCMDACCVGGCRVLSGVPQGEACTSQSRCEDGTYCAIDPNTGQGTVCSKQVGIGAACPFGNECATGTYCDFNTAQCAKVGQVGEPCPFGACAPGLYCGEPKGDGYRVCLEFAAEGEACAYYSNGCRALDNVCDQNSHTCVKYPTIGQDCFQFSQCEPAAACHYTPTENLPVCLARAELGEACGERYDEFNGFYESMECLGGLVCDGTDLNTNHCVVPSVTTVCPVPELSALPDAT